MTDHLTSTQRVPCGRLVPASGRSLSLRPDEGLTKGLPDGTTDRIIGCGIVGHSAGVSSPKLALAIEMGTDADLVLSATVAMAEAFEGTTTDLYLPRRSSSTSRE